MPVAAPARRGMLALWIGNRQPPWASLPARPSGWAGDWYDAGGNPAEAPVCAAAAAVPPAKPAESSAALERVNDLKSSCDSGDTFSFFLMLIPCTQEIFPWPQ